ncbi:uncharacterized protein Z518_06539 [Rhinocladiella mackenziei CBS 650.93]|uniref:DUF427 domain-containing protein n=1 Tax=Rhinocladiella mackenziei CBS 650.93 TaxID=1442369 RepID=A0A0D2IAZ2_9EURO|nr:uncharacterized protein Z518_06539 [Rhinocladiella mackenziei CBS 650.93]KIX02989.1 hypothetical protein Z518_06539 [Rhinocladiella mackenziei CBS 650.93]
MAAKPKLNVHNFPRPPLLEPTPRHLMIKWNGQTLADTRESYWVLETMHPPTYYLPRTSISDTFKLNQTPGLASLCEWKGRATYWDLTNTSTGETVRNKIWSYEAPTPAFKDIKGYLSFYAHDVPWECFVDEEKVTPQEGDYYGGWVTSELEGAMKGGPETWGW